MGLAFVSVCRSDGRQDKEEEEAEEEADDTSRGSVEQEFPEEEEVSALGSKKNQPFTIVDNLFFLQVALIDLFETCR